MDSLLLINRVSLHMQKERKGIDSIPIFVLMLGILDGQNRVVDSDKSGQQTNQKWKILE